MDIEGLIGSFRMNESVDLLWAELCRVARIGAAAEKRELRDWSVETNRLENCIDECRFLEDVEIPSGTQEGDALNEVIDAAEEWRQHLLKLNALRV